MIPRHPSTRPRLLAVMIAIGIVAACKPARQGAGLQSLENFAAGTQLKRNSCRGTFDEQHAESVQLLVDRVIGPNDARLRGELWQSVSAVPAPLRTMFLELGGTIQLTDHPEDYCKGLVSHPEDLAGAERSGARIDACYKYAPPSADSPRLLQIVLRSDVNTIRHALVREFGYLFAERITRLNFSRRGDETLMTGGPQSAGIAARKTALANAFFTDVAESPFFTLESLEPLTGKGSASQLRTQTKNRAKDVLGGVVSHERAERIKDYIFAEAFDSFYCNAVADADTKALAKVAKGPRVSAAKLKPILKDIDNTRVIMSFLFGRTLHVFNRLHPQMFGAAKSKGLGLTEEETDCSDDLDSPGGIAGVSGADLFGDETDADARPPINVAGDAIDKFGGLTLGLEGASDTSLPGAATELFSASPLTPTTDGLMANLSGDLQSPFDPNLSMQPLTYPDVIDDPSLPKGIRGALNSAYAWNENPPDATLETTPAGAETAQFALGGNIFRRCLKAIREGGEVVSAEARLARKVPLVMDGGLKSKVLTDPALEIGALRAKSLTPAALTAEGGGLTIGKAGAKVESGGITEAEQAAKLAASNNRLEIFGRVRETAWNALSDDGSEYRALLEQRFADLQAKVPTASFLDYKDGVHRMMMTDMQLNVAGGHKMADISEMGKYFDKVDAVEIKYYKPPK